MFHNEDMPSDSVSATYDDHRDKVIITYDKNGGTGAYVYVTITGTTPSYSEEFEFTSNSVDYTAPVYDPDQNVVVVAYRDANDSNKGNAVVIDSAASPHFTEWIGFASAAISDGEDGVIDIVGVVNASQSSLTIGAKYYINNFGVLTATPQTNREVGKAISATEILITQGSISG